MKEIILILMAVLFIVPFTYMMIMMLKQDKEYQDAHKKLDDYIARKDK